MAQLFYGKLDNASPIGNGSNSYIRVRFDATTSSTTLTNVTDVSGYFGLDKVRVGQILVESSAFPSGTVITAVDVGNNTITVEDNPSTAESQGLGRISPPQGEYFIPSASLTDPNTVTPTNFNDITGSNDTDFTSGGIVYAILGQATDSGGNAINGRFHKYTVSEVYYRNGAGSEGSIYIKWGEKGTEADSGDEMSVSTNQKMAIVALTTSESLAPMFSPAFAGITDLNTGQGVAAYQIEVQDFLDDLVTTDVFYTGSRVESNLENLNFTGSGVTVTSSGSRGVLINIPGGGGGGSTDTGSLLTTASAANNVITFTKGDASTFTVTVDTGSGGGSLFPYTGSAEITGSLEVIGFTNLTGSTFIQGTAGNDALAVSDSSGDKKFSVNSEGVVVLEEQTSEPTAVEGGIYYSHSQFYFGIE